ncbi:MAG: DNA-binding protein Alba [Candidatus Baldrarchaeia archaeon]
MSSENAVLIGKKPPISYVLAVLTLFHRGADKVCIKARGKAISKAVDVAEIVRNRFLTDVEVEKIVTGTEEIRTPDNNVLNVSTIEILLARKT